MIHGRTICLVLMLTGSGTLLAADTLAPSSLRHDPFEQPAFLRTPGEARQSDPVAAVTPNMELRSILQAGDESVVNLNGEILMIGDSFRGYQLVEVGKQSAIFVKDGAKIKLTLRQ